MPNARYYYKFSLTLQYLEFLIQYFTELYMYEYYEFIILLVGT